MKTLYEGKAKIVYETQNPSEVIIAYKDVITAHNTIREPLEGKGKINLKTSNLIYRYLENNGIKTHLIAEIDESNILAKKAQIIPVEVVVRNRAAGTFCKKYGVEQGKKLNNVVLEFCLKDDTLGDPIINETAVTALGLSTIEELQQVIEYSLKINDIMQQMFGKIDLELVDFKLEFGRVGDEIVLCDEISADSIRVWDTETGEKLDKDRFRLGLGGVIEGYTEILNRIQKFIGGIK
jgi:phosphoribosylaminoimidazole-succinocarboxamide synthase